MQTFGLIPAAGLSRRMGRPKLSLPLGERTILEHVVAAVRAGGVQDVLVVIGPSTLFLQQLAEKAGARALILPDDTPDMRATMQAGLDELQRTHRPTANDAWLLVPADHPTLAPEIVCALLQSAVANPAASIVVPCHEGRRGHPTLLRWGTVAALQRWSAGQGLNTFIRANDSQTMEIAWPSAEVLCDLDTPADYERLRKALPNPAR